MRKEEIMATIADIIKDVFDDPDLVVEERTNATTVSNWDSVAQINILMAVEERFEIELTSREMDLLQNVGDLVATVNHHITRRRV